MGRTKIYPMIHLLSRTTNALSWAAQLDRLFQQATQPTSTITPALRESVHETEDAWLIQIDLPGFTKDEVHLKHQDHSLLLEAESPSDRPFAGKFIRHWQTGREIETNAIRARLENGVLEIELPKRKPTEPETLNIEIQ